MASHWPFGHLSLKLWAKEGPGVKLVVWLPTIKSRESNSSWPQNWECEMLLERSWRGLQLWFRPCCDQTPQSGVMSSQSPGTPTGIGTTSGLQLGSPGKKSHLDVASAGGCREYYMGKVVASPKSGPWCVSWSKVLVACPNTQGCPGMWTNHVGGLFWCKFKLDLLNLLHSLIPGLPTRPSTPF